MVYIPQIQPVKGQHIFPATAITDLALRWKDEVRDGKHDEAMATLESIIVLSTKMFERLAMHEHYTGTVDLPVLVAAAQEKVMRWLEKWEPSKGEIFSWFCASADTQVLLESGETMEIAKIVDDQVPCRVACVNGSGEVVYRCVTGWHKQPSSPAEFRKIRIKNARTGYSRPVHVTWDHHVRTQDDWTRVDDLTPKHVLYLNQPTFTQDGESAILGLVLGGSYLDSSHRLSLSRGSDQRFFLDALACQFRGHVTQHKSRFGADRYLLKFSVEGAASLILPRTCNTESGSAVFSVSPVTLAYWYMASTRSRPGPVALSLRHGTPGLVSRLKILLDQVFNLKFKCVKRGVRHEFVLDECSTSAFFNVVGPYIDPGFRDKNPSVDTPAPAQIHLVEDRLVEVAHESRLTSSWTWSVGARLKPDYTGSRRPNRQDLNWKYDITVDECHNYIAGPGLLIHNSKCAKNAFRSEVVKIVHQRRRYHDAGDNLEKFFGSEDHQSMEVRLNTELDRRIRDITTRWAGEQEIGVIKYHIACVMAGMTQNKAAGIRGAAYAYGVSMDMSKFLYSWALVQLRSACFELGRMPSTDQDLFRMEFHNTLLVDMLDIITWDQMRKLVAIMGGNRIKFPTMIQLSKSAQYHRAYSRVLSSDQDPDSIAEIADEEGLTRRRTQDAFMEWSEYDQNDPYCEDSLYRDSDTTGADG